MEKKKVTDMNKCEGVSSEMEAREIMGENQETGEGLVF